MDLLFTTTTTTASTAAPIVYGSLLGNDLAVPYENSYGIASVVARDMALALFFTLASYTGRPNYPNALFHCDFEDNGWCPGFDPKNHSDIPWTLWKGKTPSNKTGPNTDHTRFNEYGSYIYLEASGGRSGETAVFTTPPVLMLSEPYYCLSYWYNMYGAGSGSIWVFWNAAGSMSIRNVVDKVAGQLSKNANDWRESTTTLRTTTRQKFFRPVVFEFRGIRGVSYKSDMALDDILLRPGKCEKMELPKTATTMTFGGITTKPTPMTTTKPSWKASNPNYAPCGDDYVHIRKQLCCNGNVKPKATKHTQCCGERTYHIIYNLCCGGRARHVNDYGCCRGRIAYDRSKRACCNNWSTYDLLKEDCVNQKVVKRKVPLKYPPSKRRRGKRSFVGRHGFLSSIFE